ncbi:hypothetical protein [Roseateles sp. P5_E7]
MAKEFVENTGKSARVIYGRLLQPGEGFWLERVGDPTPKTTQPVFVDANDQLVDDDGGLLVSGAGTGHTRRGARQQPAVERPGAPVGLLALRGAR